MKILGTQIVKQSSSHNTGNDVTISISGGVTGTATKFDGSESITIPVSSIDVSTATGVLAKNHGGTGRTDGMVTDVYSEVYSDSAWNLGGICAPPRLINGTETDANTLQSHGRYYVYNMPSPPSSQHWPTSNWGILTVYPSYALSTGAVHQIYYCAYGTSVEQIWRRHSSDHGETFTEWQIISYIANHDVNIYIDPTNGDDANDGVYASRPVKTWARAKVIIAGINACNRNIVVHFAAGEYGSLLIPGNLFRSGYVTFTDWDDTESSSEESKCPYFTELYFDGISQQISCRNLRIKTLKCRGCSNVQFNGTYWLGQAYSWVGSVVLFEGTLHRIAGTYSAMFTAEYESCIRIFCLIDFNNSTNEDEYFLFGSGKSVLDISGWGYSNSSNGGKVFAGKTLYTTGTSSVTVITNSAYGGADTLTNLPGGGAVGGTNYYILNNTPINYIHSVTPGSDNKYSLGSGNVRWTTVYANNGTVQTSDERLKTEIDVIPDDVLDAWGNVSIKQFRFKDSVSEKADEARIHTGVIAQDVLQAFEDKGLDASDYGLFCHDVYNAEYNDEYVEDAPAVTETKKVIDVPAEYDNNILVQQEISHTETTEVTPAKWHYEKTLKREAGDVYSIRYSEALALESAYLRREIKRLQDEISALRK